MSGMQVSRRQIFALAGGAVLAAVLPARAQSVDAALPDPAEEARARGLHKKLRCLVCQNQSISDSNADLARELRMIVRERITAGDSDDQIIDFMVTRYGDWVLMSPPFKPETLVLWLGPVAVVASAVAAVAVYLRRARHRTAQSALSADERGRLDALLDDGPDGLA